MNNLDDLLKNAFNDLAAEAPHNDELANTIRQRSRYRRAVMVAPIAAALAVLAVVAGTVLLRPESIDPGSRSSSACSPLRIAVLPTWARPGFSDPTPSMPFRYSNSGEVVAIVFGDPLVSPAALDRSNKILWVTSGRAAESGDDKSAGENDLRITGTLEGGTGGPGETMSTTVPGGPGPSIIDVPSAGCWHFDLAWGSHRDTIDLGYSRG